MVFKRLLCWRLAKRYNLHKWDVLLPTGCDVILERVLSKEEVVDENKMPIELVNKDITYILMMAIPVAGLVFFGARVLWRCKVLYYYLIPTLYPQIGEWAKLLFTLLPELFYWKKWREEGKCYMPTENSES